MNIRGNSCSSNDNSLQCIFGSVVSVEVGFGIAAWVRGSGCDCGVLVVTVAFWFVVGGGSIGVVGGGFG